MTLRIKVWHLVLLLLLAGFRAGAQDSYTQEPYPEDTLSHKGFDKNRLFTGGSLGMYFSDVSYVNISPLLGYRFSDWFSAGVQVNTQYEWIRYKNALNEVVEKDRSGVLGGGLFGRIYPIQPIFLHVQPEYNYVFGKQIYSDGSPDQRYHRGVPSMLMGGGISTSIGGGSAFTLMLLYDVLQNTDSPYGNKPIFRGGVNIGL